MKIKKPMHKAGLAVVISLIFGAISIAFALYKLIPIAEDEAATQAVLKSLLPFLAIATLIGAVLTFFVYLGFISLGKRFNNKFLIVVSWIILITLIAYAISNLVEITLADNSSEYLIILFTLLRFLFIIGLIVLYILLGVAMLPLKQVPFAKTVGILHIIAGATMIILVGALVYLVAFIFSAAMFSKASKKFEK